ncbi:DNA-directed RNA polymerase subunit N [Thermoplasmatales archaeon ex4484_30]|nr:MAG: DNA-directed RNA polymerase subunit N [Thermoplasmata archaeon]OYT60861.1 MAG: DNA-directed RNA polymerase subunit N [Thermoplasmatales archaeon ex4484_30]
MIIPVRCFTCGKVLGSLFEEYKKRVYIEGENPKKVLDDLKIRRYCCRRTIISHPVFVKGKEVKEPIDEAAQYE